MKKLLIATGTYLPRWDGISRFLSELVPSLSKHFKVTILAPEFAQEDRVDIVRFPLYHFQAGDYTPTKPNLKLVKKYVKEADIVFIQDIGPLGAAALYYAWKMKKPRCAFIHCIEWDLVVNSLSKGIYRRLLYNNVKRFARFCYNRCTHLFVPSFDVSETILRAGIRTDRSIVHLGVNTETFVPGDKDRAKKRLGILPGKRVIGYVGRVAREKNPMTLYHAFSMLRKQHPDYYLVFVGKSLPEYEAVLGDKKSILLAGPRDDVVPWYQAMDVYVLSSLTETTSLTTMEAMSCAVPVVCTPVGYVKSYIKDGYNGFLFQPGDSFELAKNIERVLENDRLAEMMGKNARKTIEDNYFWKITSNKIVEVLNSF